jgi:hypothetical protein
MKPRITISIATTIALSILSVTSLADWIEGLPSDKNPTKDSSNTNTSNQNRSETSTDQKTNGNIEIKNNNQTNIGSKILGNEQANRMPNTAVNGQNINNSTGLNRPWGNNNNRANYPMNPMGYGYSAAPNGYYNIVPMMPPQMMHPQPRQMFPVMTYEQQQAQMDMIRQRFEAMAQRVADAQKALAEAHQKAQMPSQTAIVVPQSIATEVTIGDVTEKQ